MKYKNKTDERLRSRLEKSVSTDKIVSSNKMKKSRSSARAAAINVGKIVNKTSEYDKTMEKAEDKVNPDVETKVVQPVVKVFNKGNITYIKYKNNDIMVSQLPKLAKTDADVKALIDSINVKKAAMNDTGSFNSFLLKQYS